MPWHLPDDLKHFKQLRNPAPDHHGSQDLTSRSASRFRSCTSIVVYARIQFRSAAGVVVANSTATRRSTPRPRGDARFARGVDDRA